MDGKKFFGYFIFIIIIFLLTIYWFVPYNTIELGSSSNSNFSLNNQNNEELQFYSNMRFSERVISYKIEDCPLQRKNDMEWAFNIIENETILVFYPVSSEEDIKITCDEKTKIQGNLFIAGEGGPSEDLIVAGNFNIIPAGTIILREDSKCEKPNIAIHELLHVLGFNHSLNSNNIMYEISKCSQTVGKDIYPFINKLYSIPSQPDLLFQDTSASMHGKYLDINFSIRNNGLKNAEKSIIKIFADEKEIKEIELEKIEIGYGRRISMENIWINQISVEKIEFVIENNFEELDKNNNQVSFEIKK